MEVTNDHLKDTFNQCRDGMITSELAQRLQGISEDINFGDKSGVTMLHVACCNGNFVIVQELLKQEHKKHIRRVLHITGRRTQPILKLLNPILKNR